jgi:hypothetical protein
MRNKECSDKLDKFKCLNDYNFNQEVGLNFEKYQNSFRWNVCKECFKGFYGLQLIDGRCAKSCHIYFKSKVYHFYYS